MENLYHGYNEESIKAYEEYEKKRKLAYLALFEADIIEVIQKDSNYYDITIALNTSKELNDNLLDWFKNDIDFVNALNDSGYPIIDFVVISDCQIKLVNYDSKLWTYQLLERTFPNSTNPLTDDEKVKYPSRSIKELSTVNKLD